jgi:glycosyltransferase involved in cell wall biosynthesis
MIPTYNCASFLQETLESVLSQDIDPAEMQIEVIDDCSTTDDPEAVVREFGQNRVSFYRQPFNVGATNNFNTCIARSQGELVHILHGDDTVLSGFYSEIQRLDSGIQGAGLFATRVFFCDEQGVYFLMTNRFASTAPSHDEAIDLMSDFNPFQFAGVVVRRSVYEQVGGFIPSLVHVADWEMWSRVASSSTLALSNKVLGSYRKFAGSDSSKLIKIAENLRDHTRFEQIAFQHGNAIDPVRLSNMITEKALFQARRFDTQGMNEAAEASWQFWCERVQPAERLKTALKTKLRAVYRGMICSVKQAF